MKATITTVVMTIGMIFATQGQEKVQQKDYNIESYDVGTYEWYHFDDDPDLYIMDGSKPQMLAEAKKQLGQYQFDRHKESGFITDGVHYKLWTHVTVDGRDAMVMLIDEDFSSTLHVGFYNGGGAPK
jgi:hypothetical protein